MSQDTGIEQSDALAPQLADPRYLHFFGLRRTGNHAIINWMAEELSAEGQPTAHFNNVSGTRTPSKEPDAIHEEIRLRQAGAAILSYEDQSYAERHALEHYNEFTTPDDTDVVLLRSFPNMLASRLQRIQNAEEQGIVVDMQNVAWATVRDLWVEYAQVITASDGSDDPTCILYDKWFTDREYRDTTADRIGFENHDLGIEFVPDNADGSSYDGLNYQGRAQEMATLDRWHALQESERARSLFSSLVTPVVQDLNHQLFGDDMSAIL